MSDQRARVLLIDEHCLFLEALRMAFQSVVSLSVVGVATNVEDGWRLAVDLQPDVVLSEIQFRGASGFSLSDQLHKQFPQIRFAILTGSCTDGLLDAALRVHVAGFLLKTDPINELANAILTMARGGSYFSSSLQHRLTTDAAGNWRLWSATLLSGLSPQQVEILRHLARGLSVKEVARALSLTAKSVDSQKYRLMRQLGIHDRVVLAHFAIEHGLIAADQVERRAS